jgi:hypothetical protein
MSWFCSAAWWRDSNIYVLSLRPVYSLDNFVLALAVMFFTYNRRVRFSALSVLFGGPQAASCTKRSRLAARPIFFPWSMMGFPCREREAARVMCQVPCYSIHILNIDCSARPSRSNLLPATVSLDSIFGAAVKAEKGKPPLQPPYSIRGNTRGDERGV